MRFIVNHQMLLKPFNQYFVYICFWVLLIAKTCPHWYNCKPPRDGEHSGVAFKDEYYNV